MFSNASIEAKVPRRVKNRRLLTAVMALPITATTAFPMDLMVSIANGEETQTIFAF
jgi:hypothetical protein